MSIITRFAPSPTGLLHIGNARTALINWLYTKKLGGKFILRIDDTDVERSKQEYIDAIKRDLEWLNLNWDSSFKQSERIELYKSAKEKLIKDGRLYPCYETQEELSLKKKSLLSRNLPPIYDRASLNLSDSKKKELEDSGIKPHWRFLLDKEEITWNDEIRGPMYFSPSNLSDPVLFRADGTMTYTLASIVDDIETSITNIIRGEDHLSNSATHIQMFKALGAKKIPTFAHLSLLVSKDQEISKRLGGFDLASLKSKSIDYMAINSFLAKLGTSDPVDYKFYMEELVESFAISKFGKAPANYDISELERLNTKLLHHMDYTLVKPRLASQGLTDISQEFWESVKTNISTIREIEMWHKICSPDFEPITIDLNFTKQAALSLPLHFNKESYGNWLNELKALKTGTNLFKPLRLALTGLESGPELYNLINMLGYSESVRRLNGA